MTGISDPPKVRPALPGGDTRPTVAIGILGIAIIFPVLSPALVPYASAASALGRRGLFLFYASLLSLLLSLLNAGKVVEADEANYFFMFAEILKTGSLWEGGTFTAIGEVTGRNEILFYFVSYIFFGLLGLSFKFVTVFWTFFAYSLMAVAFSHFFRNRLSSVTALAVFAFCAIISINFTLTAQVMRQYAAAALVLLAFIDFDRRKFSLTLLMFAALIHNSAIVFLVPWVAALYFKPRLNRIPWALILLSVVLALVAGQYLYAVAGGLSDQLEHLYKGSLKDDGDLTIFKFSSIGASIAILLYELKARFDRNLLPFFIAYTFLVVLLILTRQFPLLLLRFSFYTDFFAFIPFGMIIFRLIRYAPVMAAIALPFLANALLLIRVLYSPWTYSWFMDSVDSNLAFALVLRVLDV